MDELKEMQQQLYSLKEALSKSNITNDRLLNQVISQKMSSLNRIVWTECVTFPIILLIFIGFCLVFKINLWLVWTFAIGGLIDLLCDFRTLRIPIRDLTTKTMLQIKQKLLRQKKERLIQNSIGLPLVTAWMIWLFIEFVNKFPVPQEAKTIIIWVLAVLGVGAIIFALWLLRKIEGTANSMISEIDEKEEDNG